MARGLFRLWVVGSVAWLALMTFAFSATGNLNDLYGNGPSVSLLFGLPLAVGVLLAGLLWAGRGFGR